jgi:rhamnosyltransferase
VSASVVRPSVIVRTKNSAATVGETFRTLRSQTVSCEIVVVDSGSIDGTLEIARAHADELVQIPAKKFSYGGALNAGADRASGEIHFALSSHCFLEREDWLERSLAFYEDPRVAGTNGEYFGPRGELLFEPLFQTLEDAWTDPYWGFSNHAGSWRASVWRHERFDEQVEACEDKEWAWRVLTAGHVLVFHPALAVSSKHREQSGARALFERSRREARALARHVPVGPRSAREVIDQWWDQVPERPLYPPLFYRLNYLRAAEILGRYIGQREARRTRDEPS